MTCDVSDFSTGTRVPCGHPARYLKTIAFARDCAPNGDARSLAWNAYLCDAHGHEDVVALYLSRRLDVPWRDREPCVVQD